MTDPTRWLDDANASAHERVLLSSGRSMDPPPGAQEKVWAALQVHLGPVAGSGGDAGTNGSSGAGSSGAGSSGAGSSGASISTAVGGAKGIAAAIASVTTIAGVVAALVTTSPTAPPKTDIPTPAMVEELPVPSADTPQEEPSLPSVLADDLAAEPVVPSPSSSLIPADEQPKQSPSSRVSNAKPSVVDQAPAEEAVRARQERAGRLREESRSLGDARAALRRGDAASALEKLDALGGQFPEGVLAQEREVLAIEALARAGQRAAASARAAAFLEAHPTSPHARKVRGFLQ